MAMADLFFGHRYLGAKDVEGLHQYKYSCIDNSPMVIYCMKPIYSVAINFIPRWLHPNVMTVFGGLCTLLAFLLVSTKIEQTKETALVLNPTISSGFFATIAWLFFLAHHSDGMDGVQARRLKVSSPIGELLDHGVDSMIFSLFIFSLYISIGYTDLFPTLTFSTLNFIVPHWEKKFTGTFYLPWGYDLGMTSLFLWFAFNAYVPHSIQILQPHLESLKTLSNFCLCFQMVVCIWQAFMRMYLHLNKEKLRKPEIYSKLLNASTQLIPHFVTATLFTFWFKCSPNMIGQKYLALFVWTYSISFAHQATHLIISSITGHQLPKCRFLSQCSFYYTDLKGLEVFGEMATGTCFIFGQMIAVLAACIGGRQWGELFERNLLILFSCLFTIKHFHFLICLFRQLCTIYNRSFIFLD